jgi:hypothetical protein
MPNHCTNEVYISFKDQGTREKFLEFVKGKDEQGKEVPFTFNAIKPLPNGKWDYDWCWKNWGTKWDCYPINYGDEPVDFDEDDSSTTIVRIEFFTAWGPPEPILEKINEKFGDKIEYCRWFYRDEADMFCGYLDVNVGMNDE